MSVSPNNDVPIALTTTTTTTAKDLPLQSAYYNTEFGAPHFMSTGITPPSFTESTTVYGNLYRLFHESDYSDFLELIRINACSIAMQRSVEFLDTNMWEFLYDLETNTMSINLSEDEIIAKFKTFQRKLTNRFRTKLMLYRLQRRKAVLAHTLGESRSELDALIKATSEDFPPMD